MVFSSFCVRLKAGLGPVPSGFIDCCRLKLSPDYNLLSRSSVISQTRPISMRRSNKQKGKEEEDASSNAPDTAKEDKLNTSEPIESHFRNKHLSAPHFSPPTQRFDFNNPSTNSAVIEAISKQMGMKVQTPEEYYSARRQFTKLLISAIFSIGGIFLFNKYFDCAIFVPFYVSSSIPFEQVEGVGPEDVESLVNMVEDALLSRLALDLEIRRKVELPVSIRKVNSFDATMFNSNGYVKGPEIDLHCWPPKFRFGYRKLSDVSKYFPDFSFMFQTEGGAGVSNGVDSSSVLPEKFTIEDKPSHAYRKYKVQVRGQFSLRRQRDSLLKRCTVTFSGVVDVDRTKYVNFQDIEFHYIDEKGTQNSIVL